MSEVIYSRDKAPTYNQYQVDKPTQAVASLTAKEQERTGQALQAVRAQIQQEIDPEHFQYCVEHHVQDCGFETELQDRNMVFREEAMELYRAIHMDVYKEKDKDHVVEEMGDTLFTLFSLMNAYGVSFEECANNVLQKNLNRYNSKIAEQLRDEGIPESDLYKEAKRRSG